MNMSKKHAKTAHAQFGVLFQSKATSVLSRHKVKEKGYLLCLKNQKFEAQMILHSVILILFVDH